MPPTINSLNGLLKAKFIDTAQADSIAEVISRYAVSITPQMSRLIDHEYPDNVIGRQFIPKPAELYNDANDLTDPTGDMTSSPVPGLIHRYADRVLLKVTSICAVYCRFCFRREVVGQKQTASEDSLDIQQAVNYIRANDSIREVILSGGDPLILTPNKLTTILQQLNEIDHINMIRLHTRIPIVDSQRIKPALIAALKINKPVYIVLHCNHADELTDEASSACARLIDAGLPMLSQSVLLKGINDDMTTLQTLFYALCANRIKPYYLHHPDRAHGTTHFRVSIETGRQLMAELRKTVSGLCLPTYILEIPGGHGKIPIGPEYVKQNPTDHHYTLVAYDGTEHRYEDSKTNG